MNAAILKFSFGGELGIWTPGRLPYSCFQDKCHRPLGQLSTNNLFSQVIYIIVNSWRWVKKFFQMVPEAGLEPASRKAADFKSAVFTFSPLGQWQLLEQRGLFFKRWFLPLFQFNTVLFEPLLQTWTFRAFTWWLFIYHQHDRINLRMTQCH